jgi:hypothetical protein
MTTQDTSEDPENLPRYLKSYHDSNHYSFYDTSPMITNSIQYYPVGCYKSADIQATKDNDENTEKYLFRFDDIKKNASNYFSQFKWDDLQSIDTNNVKSGLFYRICKGYTNENVFSDGKTPIVELGVTTDLKTFDMKNWTASAVTEATNNQKEYEARVEEQEAEKASQRPIKWHRERRETDPYYYRVFNPPTPLPDGTEGVIVDYATWGTNDTKTDVTNYLNKKIQSKPPGSFVGFEATNGEFGDPVPGHEKQFIFDYTYKPKQTTFLEIPAPSPIIYSVEWEGFIQVQKTGIYTFTVECNGESHIWIGDNAICEFSRKQNPSGDDNNCHLVFGGPNLQVSNSKTATFNSPSKYYPIRIHYIGNLPTYKFQLSVSGIGSVSFVSLKNKDNRPYVPVLLYAAFVVDPKNTTDPDTKQKVYRCNYFYGPQIRNFIKSQKTIEPLTNFTNDGTLNCTSMDSNNNATHYYLYRINVDERIGKQFQVLENKSTSGMENWLPIDNSIISYGKDFITYSNYYPLSDNLTDPEKSLMDCKAECINNQRCSSIYSYQTSDGKMKCKINTSNSFPTLIPRQPTTTDKNSTLLIRKKQISNVDNCSKWVYSDGSNNNIELALLSEFNGSLYNIHYNKLAMNKDKMGVCSDPVYVNASERLQKYNSGEQQGFSNYKPYMAVESFQDTSTMSLNSKPQILPSNQDITNAQSSSKDFTIKMNEIQKNRTNIKKSVSEYNGKYKILNDDQGYEYNPIYSNYEDTGNAPLKSTRDVSLSDTKELIIQQNTTYVLCTICAAVILIAGIMIGNER